MCYEGEAYCNDAGALVTCESIGGDPQTGCYDGAWGAPHACAFGACAAPRNYGAFCTIGSGPDPACDGGSGTVCAGDALISCWRGYREVQHACVTCTTTCNGGAGSACQSSAECLPGLQCHDFGSAQTGMSGQRCSAPCVEDGGNPTQCYGLGADAGFDSEGHPTGWWPSNAYCFKGWCQLYP